MQTVHFGSSTTEFPLASAPTVSSGYTNFAIMKSDTVTAEAVLAAIQGAESYTLTTDGTADAEQDNFTLSGNVALDTTGGNILVAMRQKSAQEVTITSLQDTVDQLVLSTLGV